MKMSGIQSPTIERIKTLTVVDLRQALNERGLEKSGLKADLVKRLEKSILEEEARKAEEAAIAEAAAEAEAEVNENGDADSVDENDVSTEDPVEAA